MSILNLADYLAPYTRTDEQPASISPAEWVALREACIVVGAVAEIEAAKPGYYDKLRSDAAYAEELRAAEFA